MKFAKFSIASLALLPFMALAVDEGLDAVDQVLSPVTYVIDALIPILMTVALIVFMLGLVKYIFNTGDDTARKQGKWLMVWGIIALFVMVSVWGLTTFVGDIFGIDQTEAPISPDELNPRNLSD